jgi:hypothetical protein
MLRWLLSRFRKPASPVQPWLVDREGVVYLPTRRVELRAKV